MANKNVMRSFNTPKKDDGVRNVFDLSQRHIFSAKAGQILPIVMVDTVPGDKFELDMLNIARTMPLNTAAFARVKQNFDWVFVPYRVLWSRFNEFIAQRNDPRSALYGTSSMDNPNMTPSYVPNISLDDLYTAAFNQDGRDIHGFWKRKNALRLLDLCGYGDFQHNSELYDGNARVNLWHLLAYQKACCQFFRDSVHDPLEDAYAFNVDDVQGTSVANSNIMSVRDYDGVRSLLGLRYRPWKKDIVTGTMPTMQYGAVSSIPLSSEFSMDGRANYILPGSDIYWLSDTGRNHVSILADVGASFSSDPQGKANMAIDTTESGSNQPVTFVAKVDSGSFVKGHRAQIRQSHWHTVNVSTDQTATPPTLFDIIQLRKAEAVQKWKERTLRAGFHTDAQFMAHYGVSPDEDGRWVADFIGSYDSYINIDEVVTTANNNPASGGSDINNSVGDIAGKGVGVTQGSKLHFETNQFGVLMCLFSVVPECDYSSYGLEQNNTLIERFDYFTSEYENLGLQAVPQSIYNLFDGSTTQVIGYGPRYWNYKTALDKVHGEFNYQRAGANTGTLYDWAIPRRDLTENDNLPTLGAYYINPHVLDSIFAVEADDNESTDQFIVNAYFDIKAIRPMSVIGLPY